MPQSDLLSPQASQDAISAALDHARRHGATASEATLGTSAGLSVTVRMGDLELLKHHRDRGLQVTVFLDRRKGSASTSDLSVGAIADTVDAALAIARHAGEDPFAGLVEAESLATSNPDLDLFHPWDLEPGEAIRLATECEAVARDHDARIENSEGATVRASAGLHAYGNSHGFLKNWRSSAHRMSCAVIARDTTGMQQDHDYTVARAAADLAAPAMVGREAATRAVRRLGARRMATAEVPVLFEAPAAATLFGHFVSAVSGSNLYRRSSFLLDQIDRPIFPEWLNIDERPFLTRGLGSRPFDDDGVAPVERPLVAGGILRSYVLGGYSARRLGLKTTGNASGITNLVVGHGTDALGAMIRRLHRGFLLTDLMGFGVNLVSGDYSRGASGFWVENGEIQHPVEEVTVAGNLRDMFRSIVAIGADVDRRHAIRTGPVLIERMTLAGK
jgi:PmbA protein